MRNDTLFYLASSILIISFRIGICATADNSFKDFYELDNIELFMIRYMR